CPASGPGPAAPWTGAAGNGSTMYVTPAGGSVSAYIIDKNGMQINPPVSTNPSPGSISSNDSNGNTISSGRGAYTDTLGYNVLNVVGSAPSNTGLSYAVPSGAAPAYVVSYRTYTVRTNFGCSGIGEYNTNRSIHSSLVDRVTLPDGSYYQFNY